MSVATFTEYVRRRVSEIREDFPELSSDDDAFAVWCVGFLHQLPLDEAVECTRTASESGARNGVDAVVIDESDGVAYLMRAKYSFDSNQSVDARTLSELQAGLGKMKSEDHSEAAKGAFAITARAVRSAIAGDADVVLQVVVFGDASTDLRLAAADLESEPAADGKISAVETWDLQRLDKEYDARTTVRDLRGTTIDLAIVGEVLPIPEMTVEGLRSYNVVVLDGNSLAHAARAHGPRLVDLNVRYQLRKTKINDSIASTATASAEQPKFLVLNNGLTIICDKLVTSPAKTIQLENPQIVNGAQTALTIGDNLEKILPGQIQVLARVMEVDRATGEGSNLAAEISAATNRQNPVSSADLKAHDPLQLRIESDLSKLSPPWYYERRRNSWASLPIPEQQRYAGCISKEDLAQRYRAFLGAPAKSITSKAAVFEQTTLYGTLFDRGIPVEAYVLANQLFGYYQALLNKTSEPLRKAFYSEFDEDTRALLIRARNQFAAHATAVAAGLLWQRYPKMSKEKMVDVAMACHEDGGAYGPLHRLVVMTLVKWTRAARKAAAERNDTFSIKDSLEDPSTFGFLLEDAKVTAAFLKDKTLDLLPE